MQLETSDGHTSGIMKQTAGFMGLEFAREDKTQNINLALKIKVFAMTVLSNLIFI